MTVVLKYVQLVVYGLLPYAVLEVLLNVFCQLFGVPQSAFDVEVKLSSGHSLDHPFPVSGTRLGKSSESSPVSTSSGSRNGSLNSAEL